MKTVVIKEFGEFNIPDMTVLDLSTTPVKDCLGCWTCWWKTPGRCVHKDLDSFYHEYLAADKAVFFAKLSREFVSGNLKTLLDRMIPHFLPYCIFSDGGTMHSPRYEKYPDIEFYYEGEFESEEGRSIFYDYINKVFKQFYSKNISIKPISDFNFSEDIKR